MKKLWINNGAMQVGALAITLTSCATIAVHPTSENQKLNPKKYGIFYCLPRTEFDVEVIVEKSVFKRSVLHEDDDYQAALKKLEFPLEIVSDDKTSYKVKSVSINEIYLPDPTKRFFVEFKRRNNPFLTKDFAFTQNVEGFLSEGSFEYKNNVPEVSMAAIEGVTEVALKMNGYSLPSESANEKYTEHQVIVPDIPVPEQLVKRVNDLHRRKSSLLLSDVSDFQKVDVSQLLNMINVELKELKKVLQGEVKKTTTTYVLRVKPVDQGSIRFVLDEKGVPALVDQKTESEAYSTAAYEIVFSNMISIDPISHMYNADNNKHVGFPKSRGIHYAIPASVEVTVQRRYDSKALYHKQHNIPQFGDVAFLPPRVGLFQNKISWKLDPKTGALLSFTGNAKEIETGKYTEFTGTMAGNAGEVLKKADEKSEEQKLLEKLEYDVKVKELEVKLDSLNNVDF